MRALCLPLLLSLAACGALTPRGVAPKGLVCDRMVIPASGLQQALDQSRAGDCVILPSGTYQGTFVLPENVSLAASEGATVTLSGGDPVLTIRGGSRSTVQGIRVVATGGGIAIDPGPANLMGVAVSQSQTSAVTSTCTQPDCASREVVLTACELTQNAVGLRVNGARVRVEGGRIADQTGTSLSAGTGVVATAGAWLQLNQVTVENNANMGVLIDGAATRSAIDGCTVRNNQTRGIWVQGQTADAGETTVTITGGEVSANGVVGIGSVDSAGLVVRQVTVQDTVSVHLPIDIQHSADIGDGIGLFSGTVGATLDQVVLQRNARAQLIADSCGPGVTVTGTMSGGQYRAVLQHLTTTVDVPTTLIDHPPADLAVSAPSIGLSP